jgi:hypothetical protein
MRKQFLIAVNPRLLPYAIASMLLFTGMVATLRGDGQVRLTPNVMAQARGGNQGKNLVSGQSCNALTGLSACTSAFQSCVTCITAFYAEATGAGGAYDTGMPGGGSCGTQYTGICQSTSSGLRCFAAAGGNTNVNCTAPPGTPMLQPATP